MDKGTGKEKLLEKGYIQIYTGDGKGKTTAALGLALRAAGAGLRVYIAQFMKKGEYSEIRALRRLSDYITVDQFGTGRFIRGTPGQEDIEAARQGLAAVREAMNSGKYDLVILEEVNVAYGSGVLTEKQLLGIIDEKPEGTELLFTGRGGAPAVFDKADLITEMKAVRHYFEKGVGARTGIEN
ncbi:MAG: cob(I)yrinic acid a,c-diamide adenosyltransferase [Desulfobacteraceae bacterium]|nr:cob(I)yrinic acid a,c-diamide adenosyltransferase [Desulfobacteraceae bacterium]